MRRFEAGATELKLEIVINLLGIVFRRQVRMFSSLGSVFSDLGSVFSSLGSVFSVLGSV